MAGKQLTAEEVRAMELARGERLSFEAHVRQELARINEKLDKLLAPPQVRHAKDLLTRS